MEEAKALAQHQQHLLLQQQQQQQAAQAQQTQQHQQQQQHHHHHQQQQQFMLLQHFHKQQQQAQQMAQSSAISRFPSNIDAHLRPLRPPINNLQHNNPNPNPNPSPSPSPNPNSNPKPNSVPNPNPHQHNAGSNSQQQPQQSSTQQQQLQQQQKMMRADNHLELQMAYQDAWRVCRPDFKRPFSSLEDACERLLPYHVVADYEAEEDDRILDSDTTGQILSRSQQWDHNIAAKVAEFTATFEKQALAFNIISRKRAQGEFRSEERMMIEQAMCHEEKRSYLELKTELELRERAGQEAKMRMTAMAQAEQARAESQVHAEMLSRGPIRASALGSQVNDISIDHNMGEQDHGVNPEEVMNGWGNNMQRDEKEPSEDFLNDDENDNEDTEAQEGWRGTGEFDLNTR